MTKRLMDLMLAGAALMLFMPVLVAVAILIRISLGSPILFRQLRPGRGGAPFELVKFRTMLAPAPDGAAADADRLTGVGRFLRASSLDELPELWNVLRGDMSLVGPRPLLMQYLPRYSERQARRHEVRPGLTGWAQVNGRNALSWEQKFELDLWYVENRSFALDCKILALTVLRIVKPSGISAEGSATMPEFLGTTAAVEPDAKPE